MSTIADMFAKKIQALFRGYLCRGMLTNNDRILLLQQLRKWAAMRCTENLLDVAGD